MKKLVASALLLFSLVAHAEEPKNAMVEVFPTKASSNFCGRLFGGAEKALNKLLFRRTRVTSELDWWYRTDARVVLYEMFHFEVGGKYFQDTLSLIAKMGVDGTDLALQAVLIAFRRPFVLTDSLLQLESSFYGIRETHVYEPNAQNLANWIFFELKPEVRTEILNFIAGNTVATPDHSLIPSRAHALQVVAKLGPEAGQAFKNHLKSVAPGEFKRQLENEAREASKNAVRLSWKREVGVRTTTFDVPMRMVPIDGLVGGPTKVSSPIYETVTLEPFFP